LDLRDVRQGRRPVSADYAESEPRRATALHQLSDLMPVDIVGIGLGQWPRDAEALELSHAPFMYGVLVVVLDSLVASDARGWFHHSSLHGVSEYARGLAQGLARDRPLLLVELVQVLQGRCAASKAAASSGGSLSISRANVSAPVRRRDCR
jgi:hypothetical protein